MLINGEFGNCFHFYIFAWVFKEYLDRHNYTSSPMNSTDDCFRILSFGEPCTLLLDKVLVELIGDPLFVNDRLEAVFAGLAISEVEHELVSVFNRNLQGKHGINLERWFWSTQKYE